jgi:hypothetical protein
MPGCVIKVSANLRRLPSVGSLSEARRQFFLRDREVIAYGSTEAEDNVKRMTLNLTVVVPVDGRHGEPGVVRKLRKGVVPNRPGALEYVPEDRVDPRLIGPAVGELDFHRVVSFVLGLRKNKTILAESYSAMTWSRTALTDGGGSPSKDATTARWSLTRALRETFR